MRQWIYYDPATGEIRRWLTQPHGEADAGAADSAPDFGDGLSWMEGDGAAQTHHVQGGQIVAYTAEQAAAKAARPAWPCRWDNTAMAWVDLRSLDDIKGAAIARADADIARQEAAQARPLRELVVALASGGAAPAAARKSLADVDQAIRALRAVRAQIEASTTAEQISAIPWPQ